MNNLKSKLEGQLHLLDYWDELDMEQQSTLVRQIGMFDVPVLNSALKKSLIPKPPNANEISRIDSDRIIDKQLLSSEELNRLETLGLKAISENKVAAVVMAGGQATRLGADKPKGVLGLNINLSQRTDSLLFLQALQLVFLIRMAKKKFPKSNPTILWLVMTSEATHDETKDHVNNVIEELGFPKDDVIYFVQNQLPCFDFNGKILLADKFEIATSPDGGGGIYRSLQPLLPMLESRGVQYFHVYCVDNILCRVADPIFIGATIDKNADSSTKVIEKKDPKEAVGHVCRVNGHVKVIEYSEIPADLAELRESSGKLFLREGSIANHIFTLDLLKIVCGKADSLPYHIAKKKIPYYEKGHKINPEEINGIKLELFIFDAFYYSNNFLVYQVPAHEEFSPLKNPDSAGKDCFSTCVNAYKNTHWIRDACNFVLSEKEKNEAS